MSERGGYSCRLDACTLGVSQWIRGLLPVTSDIWMSQEQSEEFVHIRRIQCRAANHPPSWFRWFRNLIRILTRHLLGKVFWACPTKRRPWAKETSWLDGWMDFSLHNKCSTSVKMSWQLCPFHILSHLVYGKSNLKVKWIQKTQTERSYIKQLNKSKLSLCPHVWTDFLSCGRLDKMLLVSLLFSNTFLLHLLPENSHRFAPLLQNRDKYLPQYVKNMVS